MMISVITMSVWQCRWYLIIVVLTSNFKSLWAAWGSWANVELHLTTDTFNQLMNANYQFQNQYSFPISREEGATIPKFVLTSEALLLPTFQPNHCSFVRAQYGCWWISTIYKKGLMPIETISYMLTAYFRIEIMCIFILNFICQEY